MNVLHHRYMRMNPQTGSCTTGASLDVLTHYRMRSQFDSEYTDLVELVPVSELRLSRDDDVIAIIRRIPWPHQNGENQ